MYRMAKIYYQVQNVSLPEISKIVVMPGLRKINYSLPIRMLIEEHKLIKRWIDLIPEIIETIDIHSQVYQELIKNCVDFVNSYTDKFHHAKEEQILFKFFDENLAILQGIYQEHELIRSQMKATLESLHNKDQRALIEYLSAYRQLVAEHLKKEEEVVYPWIDRHLSMTQVADLYSKFQAAETVLSRKQRETYNKFVSQLEETRMYQQVVWD